MFFRLFFALHLCFVHDAVDFCVVYDFFFFHSFGRCRRLHLRTFWSATKTNSNGFQQTLIQMQHLNFSFQNVHCSMSSKTHSKRWRISDVICELGLAAASFFSCRRWSSLLYTYAFFLVRLPMSLNTRNAFFWRHVNTKNS